MDCVQCNGEMEDSLTTYTGKTTDCVVVIKNIECNKCDQCGAETYNQPEAELISQIVKEIRKIPLELAVTDAKKWKLMKSQFYGKIWLDNGWGMFTNFILYKLFDQGKPLIKVDKWFPSSKMCHCCGLINENLTLSDREWTCECGEHHDRDWNAAINIKREGINIFCA